MKSLIIETLGWLFVAAAFIVGYILI